MAELPSSSQQALQKLNEQLTCPICLEPYTDPKLLQCFHVFCENCLNPLARQTPQGQVVECPNCRQPTSLPQNGVPGLQGAFLIHHLFDIQDILKKVSSPAKSKCDKCETREPCCYCRTCGFICDSCKKPHLEWKEFSSHEIISLDQLTGDVTNLVPPVKKVLQCSKHPDKHLDLFCETCEEMICRDCIIQVHRDHQYDLVRDAFPKHKDVIVASLQPVEQQLASVNKALEGLDTRCGQITAQRQTIETDIKRNIHQIHEALEARQEELITQLDQMTRQKMKSLAAQRDQLELVATRLKSCRDFLQESLRTGSQEEILDMKKPFVQQVKEMTAEFKPETLVPEEQADLKFTSSQTELTRAFQQFWKVHDSFQVCPEKCRAEGSGLQVVMVGEAATATVCVVDQEGRKCQRPVEVSCELVSSDRSSRVRGEVERVRDEQYQISYRPERRGRHQLHIRVEDTHISGSPFTTAVITTTPTNIITGIKGPWGVAVNERGQIVVAERTGHCISIFNGSREKVRSFGSNGSGPGLLSNPHGVALTATGDILVCDCCNHRIQLFSPEGKSLKCVGTKGNGHLQFLYPEGIAVHPHSNKIYVTDNNNHRVQILNANLTFSSTFGSHGSDNGQFNSPRSICFDNTGNVYVADHSNHRVQVFTAGGEYIRQFGKKGGGEGELYHPQGIAIDSSDIVYVSDCGNHRISLFTRDGHFLRSFGTNGEGPGQFNAPTDIAVDKDGKIYVAEKNNNRVQVF